MEILALKLFVPEDAVNRLLLEHLPKDVPVQKVAVRISPEGVRFQGEYPTVFMNVAFETLWGIAVSGGKIELRLADVKVSGFPATMLRGVIFKVLKESTSREPGISVDGETIHVDLDRLLTEKGLPLKLNLQAVRCSVGSLIVESSSNGVVA